MNPFHSVDRWVGGVRGQGGKTRRKAEVAVSWLLVPLLSLKNLCYSPLVVYYINNTSRRRNLCPKMLIPSNLQKRY